MKELDGIWKNIQSNIETVNTPTQTETLIIREPNSSEHFSDLLRVRNPRRSSFYLLSSHLFLKYDGLTVSLGGRPASRRHIALLAINFDPVSGGSVTVTGRISFRGVATGTKCVFFWFMTHWRTALALGLWALPRGEEVQTAGRLSIAKV